MRACVLLLGLVAPPLVPDESMEARALLERAIAAQGGADKLAGQPARTWKGKGTFYNSHPGGMAFVLTGCRQGTDQIALSIEAIDPEAHYRRVLVLDGDRCWLKMNDRLEELKGEALAEEQQRAYSNWLTTLLPLRDAQFDLSLLPSIQVDGKEAVGLLVRRAGRREVRLYFDAESMLLVKREVCIKDIQRDGKGVIEEVLFSAYRDLGGVRHATRVEVYWDGKLRYELDLPEQARKEKLDAAVFGKP
jgi:hypothetical protein